MFGLKTRRLIKAHPTLCVVVQFCARGSMFDVLAKARSSPLLAQQLDWPKRVSMALDAAKVGPFTFFCCTTATLHESHHYRHSSASAKGMCSVLALSGSAYCIQHTIGICCTAGALFCHNHCNVLATLTATACCVPNVSDSA